MPKIWDESLRKMVRDNPHAFVELLLSRGQVEYVGQLPEKLKPRNPEVDALVIVQTESGEKMLIHFEFQTRNDSTMPERLLEYNILARGEHNMPVLSCVLYLRRDGKVKHAPLCWTVPFNNYEILTFDYIVIEVANLLPEDIRKLGHPALLPLLPLTKGGATEEIVSKMLDDLVSQDKRELAEVGLSFAWWAFKQIDPEKAEWLRKEYKNMFEILREEELYQEILEEGSEVGRVKTSRKFIMSIVQLHFLPLEQLAREQIMKSNDGEALEVVATRLLKAQTLSEAEKLLLSLGVGNQAR